MQTENNKPTPRETPAVDAGASSGWLLAVGFLILAAVLWLTSTSTATPSAATPAFDASLIAEKARRPAPSDPPVAMIAGFEQRCNSCHDLFESEWDGSRPLIQHAHVSLDHGINNQCNNCHDREDRESLILHSGSTVPFSNTEQLCSQCHGPVFRDWERGTHGKTLGAWDQSSDLAERLSCAQCHDPHSPAFGSIPPLPGPNTLRMGDAHAPESHKNDRNPLMRWNRQENSEGDH